MLACPKKFEEIFNRSNTKWKKCLRLLCTIKHFYNNIFNKAFLYPYQAGIIVVFYIIEEKDNIDARNNYSNTHIPKDFNHCFYYHQYLFLRKFILCILKLLLYNHDHDLYHLKKFLPKMFDKGIIRFI